MNFGSTKIAASGKHGHDIMSYRTSSKTNKDDENDFNISFDEDFFFDISRGIDMDD